MLSYRAIILALLAVGATSALAHPAERPYAPELYDRQALEEQPKFAKRSIPGAADRPYSPDLYFRRALATDEMDQNLQRSESAQPTKTLGKRSAGASCKDATNACSDGHFCSTVNFRCQQKRSLGGSCRHSDGCSQGLECLNFQCIESKVKEGINQFKDKVESWKDGPEAPSPSGNHKFPIPFRKRTLAPPSGGDNGNDPFSQLPQEIKDKLKNLPQDLENLPQEVKDHLNSWWAPKQSGAPWDKKKLQWTH